MTALPSSAPPALDRLIATCLAKDPEDRFQTAHDVKLQLELNPQAVERYRLLGFENRLLEKRDFADDHGVLQAAVAGAQVGAPAALLQRLVEINLQRLQRRREAEDHACDDRQRQREGEHQRVEAQVNEESNARRDQVTQKLKAQQGDRDAADATCE